MTDPSAVPLCSECARVVPVPCTVPTEPPVGTWVKDKYGAVHYRKSDGWAPAPTGFYACGVWSAMWHARGPLVECGEWGRDAN